MTDPTTRREPNPEEADRAVQEARRALQAARAGVPGAGLAVIPALRAAMAAHRLPVDWFAGRRPDDVQGS